MRRFSTLDNQSGSALALALMALLLLSALAISLATQSLSTWDAHDQDAALDRSSYVVRAGLERACAEILLVSDNWATVSPGLLYDAEVFADGDFDVEVVHATPDQATLEVRGRVEGSRRVLRFDLERLQNPAGGGGNTTGVRVEAVYDITIANRFG